MTLEEEIQSMLKFSDLKYECVIFYKLCFSNGIKGMRYKTPNYVTLPYTQTGSLSVLFKHATIFCLEHCLTFEKCKLMVILLLMKTMNN